MKDILGRGLINDDSIAILELVKNAKDAGSPSVSISFSISLSEADSKGNQEIVTELTIMDYGKGMTEFDINTKWLNIAYSEKKGKTERNYAGNKGVGRFSCDRLGTNLVLYTKAAGDEHIKLPINWELFEDKGANDEISGISLTAEKLTQEEFLEQTGVASFKTGTILKITNLRSSWSSKKLKKLVGELEKFSPSLEEDFEVYIKAAAFFDENETLSSLDNGKINNSILDKLTLKTTYISSTIDADGMFIETCLYFQDEVIYWYKAKNPYKNLKNIKAEIHYLDTVSKAYFKRKTGVTSVSYGSIFLFYNGFRISPYGNAKNDWLGIDQRKGQGSSRYLGTREVFGRIDIQDNDDSFSVITSREGLAHNSAYIDLVANDDRELAILKNGSENIGYITLLFRQLENFVVGGLNWNRLVDKLGQKTVVTLDDVNRDPERYGSREIDSDEVREILEKLIRSNLEIVDHDFNAKVIKGIKQKNIEKFEKYKEDFIAQTKDKSLVDLTPSEKGAVKRIIEEEVKQKEAALEERDFAERKASEVKSNLIVEKEKNRYLLESRKHLSPDAESLIHTVKLTNSKIRTITQNLLNSLSQGEVERHKLIDRLSKILAHSNKALKMTQLATRASFTSDMEKQNIDLFLFVREYIEEQTETHGSHFKVEFNDFESSCDISTDILALTVVIDNLISNSKKWGSTALRLTAVLSANPKIVFSDNGQGVARRFLDNPEAMFELGTKEQPVVHSDGGSGIGLYHVKSSLKSINATIKFLGNGIDLKGAAFEVEFKK